MLIKILIDSNMRDAAWNMRKYRSLKIKQTKLQEDILFLKKCKSVGVFPRFIKVRMSVKNSRSMKAELLAKKIWLRNEINFKYAMMNENECQLYEIFGKIIQEIQPLFPDLLTQEINDIESTTKRVMYEKKYKLKNKLEALKNAKPSNLSSNLEIPSYVINLSNQIFSEDQMKLLNKGLKHKITPNKTPLEEIVANIEIGIMRSELSNTDKISARVECKNVIEKFKNENEHPKYNKKEVKIIKEIKEKNVLVMKPDKGKGVVIMDKIEYEKRMMKMLAEGPYEELRLDKRWKDGNPVHRMETEVLDLMKDLKQNSGMNYFTYRSLIISNPKMPALYGLPKIHKIGDKMRPIVSNIKAPTSKISKYLVKKFEDLNYPKGLAVKNSIDFVNKLKDVEIKNNEVMVSFDVVGLFPNIPLDVAFTAIENFLESTSLKDSDQEILLKLSKLCMKQNIFEFRGKFYQQKTGASIGNSASPLIADFFMSQFEQKIKTESWFPRFWTRYVDDVFAIMDREKVDEVLEKLNSYYQTIEFTKELEENSRLPFLDLMLTKNDEKKIEFEIFRKPTDSQLMIRADSFHHKSHQHASFHSMFHRLFNIPLSSEKFKKELNYIKETGDLNGFDRKTMEKIFKKHEMKSRMMNITSLRASRSQEESKSFIGFPFYGSLTENLKRKLKRYNIQVGFKNPGKMSDLMGSLKDQKVEDARKSGIYKLECENCDSKYIGMTKRQLKTRLKEHLADCSKPLNQESAMAFHCITNGHQLKNEIKLLKEVDENYKLSTWESLELMKHKNENLANIYKEGNSPSILFETLI